MLLTNNSAKQGSQYQPAHLATMGALESPMENPPRLCFVKG